MFMANEALSDGKQSAQYWINLGLALLTIASAGYLVLFENALYARETEYILSDYVYGKFTSNFFKKIYSLCSFFQPLFMWTIYHNKILIVLI